MNDVVFDAALRELLRRDLERLARRLGDGAAVVHVEHDPPTKENEPNSPVRVGRAPADERISSWSVRPTGPDRAAVQWHVSSSDPDTTYLTIGRFTEVHVLTTPRKQTPTEAAASIMEVVDAVVSGRFREEAWFAKGSGRFVNSLGWIRAADDDRWRPIGETSRPLPLLRRRFEHESYRYLPYDRAP